MFIKLFVTGLMRQEQSRFGKALFFKSDFFFFLVISLTISIMAPAAKSIKRKQVTSHTERPSKKVHKVVEEVIEEEEVQEDMDEEMEENEYEGEEVEGQEGDEDEKPKQSKGWKP